MDDGNNNHGGQIRNFYKGQSIFITGATGFMGKVLIHKLLSSCPELHKVYLLIRPKKGMAPKERMNVIFNTPIFQDWKTNKVSVV